MDDEPQRWDVQGFHVGDAGRAMWSTGLTGSAQVIDYLTHALVESDAAVFLVRRGPQVELEAPEIHPYRLVAVDARDRLARHIHLDGLPAQVRERYAHLWDNQPEYVDKEPAYRQADAILAAITAPELTLS